MLSELCGNLKNYFIRDEKDIHLGSYTIANGSVPLSFLQEGQYFRIVGSVFNDGVYKYPASNLTDETFNGAVWAMSVPKEVVDLNTEIDAWIEKYGASAASPYTSESFGGYSYTKASSGAGGKTVSDWRTAFAGRLFKWRKI